MTTTHDLKVQPILVTLDGSHLDVITAVARASCLRLLTQTLDNEPSAWAEWLTGSATKSVRTATPNVLTRARQAPGVAVAEANGVTAIAYSPLTVKQMPNYVRRSRVNGTDVLPHTPAVDVLPDGFAILIRADLEMTTGKAAAQAAHALVAAAMKKAILAEPAAMSAVLRHAAASASFAMVSDGTFDNLRDDATVVILDEGHTEIPARTATALAVTLL